MTINRDRREHGFIPGEERALDHFHPRRTTGIPIRTPRDRALAATQQPQVPALCICWPREKRRGGPNCDLLASHIQFRFRTGRQFRLELTHHLTILAAAKPLVGLVIDVL